MNVVFDLRLYLYLFSRWRTMLNDFLILWEQLCRNQSKMWGWTDPFKGSDILYGTCEKHP